ncbi:MAG: pseudouridine-5'-phosphate glycosidase [Anaerolineales bacterium]|nr:pseudouridine-5'-phosphate glycosidase [Anaerolineales bacterium]
MIPLKIKPDIEAALAAGQPVVALESTVITHGLPYPDNLNTARLMEAAVREGGALPATIALIQGVIHIGLTDEQLCYLAERPAGTVRKCSRRDFAITVANKEDGATTVAGTMIAAAMAGIPIFATGGIGGVHRGHPFDVSADLAELGQTPVAVVSSGPKQILDLDATREILETNGVTVVGYGSDKMAAFYCRESEHPADVRLDTPAEVARLIRTHQQLGLQSGLLISVPVPAEDGLDYAEIDQIIDVAAAEADAAGIHGAASTPWLLRRMVELSGGRTLKANTSLLANNGRTAAQIAVALSEI